MVRQWFYIISIIVFIAVALLAQWWPALSWSLIFFVPLFLLGVYDSLQSRHTVLRNFPIVGHGRYWMEVVRPEIQQYFIENNVDAFPIEREFRSVVYQRAKGELETRPYGTQRDVYRIGYEWASHSIAAKPALEEVSRIIIGPECPVPAISQHNTCCVSISL